MIRKGLILKIFNSATMQRWNDKIRPVELTELDKQAHKMIIAYLLGKLENRQLNWVSIIEGGMFDFLQRLVVTDLKPQIFYKIKKDKSKYRKLNEWVFKELETVLSPLGEEFCQRFKDYFSKENDALENKILNAAHFYATRWEFDIILRANPKDYEIEVIRDDLNTELEKLYKLKSIKVMTLYSKYRRFIDLCGLLRFQARWSHFYRVPKTSVLGHMLIVAILSYLFSREIKACEIRCINNYLTGLFHDLPEVLTKDISSPVKSSIEGLDELIKQYEKEQMDKEVYKLIPRSWHHEMKMFTENEFSNIITEDGKIKQVSSEDMNGKYNIDKYNPRDGDLVKAGDDLAAFVEAYLATKNGIATKEFVDSQALLREKYEHKTISGIRFGEIYADFD